MSAIVIDGGLVHYEAFGRGKPVLFLHGWLGSWRYWMRTMEEAADKYRTYALDLWGFGDTDKSKVGILLVGHGQPDEWDVEWSTETEQEIGFRKDVLKLLEADGYRPENLSLAWMEFKEPEPADKVQEFSRNGVEKVLYFSAAISADAIHSQWDVPALVNKARVREGFPLINLGAWNDDPIVIQAIKEKIDVQMN